MKRKVCMVIQDSMVKGGIAAVINGYKGSKLENDFDIIYVESYKDGNKLAKITKAVRGYLRFMKVILVDKPELIHIHSSFGPSFYRKIPFIYIASLAKSPIINHIHGADFEYFYLNASEKKKKLIKNVYNKCSVLVALSDEWKERLKLIVPESKIRIIENYSFIHEEALIERNNREANKQVLFLGEIGKRKGCYDIPDVVAIVSKVMPDVKFILCGSGDIEEIKKILKKMGLTDNVEFPGWVRGSDKDRIIRESDLFFLPSYNEGMPMSILDAMGYGMPIVSTNVGGISKIVVQGQNGYIFEPGDINSFANSIIKILLNNKIRKEYSKVSMKIVLEKYNLKSHLKLLGNLYKELIH